MIGTFKHSQGLLHLVLLELFDFAQADIHGRPALVIFDAQVGALYHQTLDHVGRLAAVAGADRHVQRCLPFCVLRVDVDARLGDQVRK